MDIENYMFMHEGDKSLLCAIDIATVLKPNTQISEEFIDIHVNYMGNNFMQCSMMSKMKGKPVAIHVLCRKDRDTPFHKRFFYNLIMKCKNIFGDELQGIHIHNSSKLVVNSIELLKDIIPGKFAKRLNCYEDNLYHSMKDSA